MMQLISNYLDKNKSSAYAGKTEFRLCRMEILKNYFAHNHYYM